MGVYQTPASEINQDPESKPNSAERFIVRHSHSSTFPEVLVEDRLGDIIVLHGIVQWTSKDLEQFEFVQRNI